MARTLTVYLAADTSRFRTGMAQAGNAVDGPQGFGGRVRGLSSTLGNVLGPAMIGAGIGVAVMAGKFAVDGVQAAIAQEKEMAILANTLDNLGLGDATADMEEWIDKAARATTFSDSQLRPAMATLARVTGNVADAQALANIAMDVAVGTGQPLETITKALAKAADGNTGALSRLIPGLDKATLKSGNLHDITGLLSERFAGAASTAADTWDGKIGNVTEAFGELQESFGGGFLEGLSTAEGGVDGLTSMMYDNQETIEEFGHGIGEAATSTLELMAGVNEARGAITDWMEDEGLFNAFVRELMASLGILTGGVNTLANAWSAAYDAYMLLQGVTTVKDVTYTGNENATLTPPNRPEYDSQVPRAITANQVGTAIYKVLADTDARKGYVVGGVLR